ncbi:MAG: hypothetical protein ACTH8F_15305 [Microbacterium sp.]|uniref:hypothetical protein n=1 Tax=Microbacterium sp. TaxID=51671 RepID=UPI003F9D5A32
MGQVAYLREAASADQPSVRRKPDHGKALGSESDEPEMPLEGSISLAAVLGSIMLSLNADGVRTYRAGE